MKKLFIFLSVTLTGITYSHNDKEILLSETSPATEITKSMNKITKISKGYQKSGSCDQLPNYELTLEEINKIQQAFESDLNHLNLLSDETKKTVIDAIREVRELTVASFKLKPFPSCQECEAMLEELEKKNQDPA